MFSLLVLFWVPGRCCFILEIVLLLLDYCVLLVDVRIVFFALDVQKSFMFQLSMIFGVMSYLPLDQNELPKLSQQLHSEGQNSTKVSLSHLASKWNLCGKEKIGENLENLHFLGRRFEFLNDKPKSCWRPRLRRGSSQQGTRQEENLEGQGQGEVLPIQNTR